MTDVVSSETLTLEGASDALKYINAAKEDPTYLVTPVYGRLLDQAPQLAEDIRNVTLVGLEELKANPDFTEAAERNFRLSVLENSLNDWTKNRSRGKAIAAGRDVN